MKYRKLLLSYLRNGDYAHAGDVEAIEIAMQKIPKNSEQQLIDIGCGLGGTANYLMNNGWGKVTGIDIDEEVVNFANNQYPNLTFYQCDVLNINNLFRNIKFDILYLFNAFFCFESQIDTLRILKSIANKNSNLILFDYASNGLYNNPNPFANQPSLIKKYFNPINIHTIDKTLLEAGWKLENIIDLTDKFLIWYKSFINKMNEKKDELIYKFKEQTFQEIYDSYSNLISYIENNKLGGAIVYAKLNVS